MPRYDNDGLRSTNTIHSNSVHTYDQWHDIKMSAPTATRFFIPGLRYVMLSRLFPLCTHYPYPVVPASSAPTEDDALTSIIVRDAITAIRRYIESPVAGPAL